MSAGNAAVLILTAGVLAICIDLLRPGRFYAAVPGSVAVVLATVALYRVGLQNVSGPVLAISIVAIAFTVCPLIAISVVARRNKRRL